MKNGYYNGKYYISASMLAQIMYDKEQVLDRWFKRKPLVRTEQMKQGEAWHEKLGYTNKVLYSRELVLDDGTVVVLFGIPDCCDYGLEELKTVEDYVSSKKLNSARVQVLVYLYLLDLDVGRLVFVSRKTGEIVYCEDVKRDDERLKKIVEEFIYLIEGWKTYMALHGLEG